jgi:hypothetical protein
VLVLWLALAPTARGSLDCGSTADFESSLAELLPDQRFDRDEEVVELSREEGGVVVRLRRGDGEIVGVRRLVPTSCNELARAVAVVVAAWHARGGELLVLPGPVGEPAPLATAMVVARPALAASSTGRWA